MFLVLPFESAVVTLLSVAAELMAQQNIWLHILMVLEEYRHSPSLFSLRHGDVAGDNTGPVCVDNV